MVSGVAVIVRCGVVMSRVHATLESVCQQTLPAAEIVLVSDPTTPESMREWLEAIAQAKGAQHVVVESPMPGGIRNAGVQASRAPYLTMLDAGNQFDGRCLEQVEAMLQEEPSLDLVTSWLLLRGPGDESQIVRCDAEELIGNAEAVHSSSVFSRYIWQSIGGFDDTLTALENYDFWLRAIESGARANVIKRPLVIVPLWSDAIFRRDLSEPGYNASLDRVLRKNLPAFARRGPAALFGREQTLIARSAAYGTLLKERDSNLQRLQTLQQRAAELGEVLSSAPSRDEGIPTRLFRSQPLSRNWGFDRGTPVDRIYIERFLSAHASDIRGRVLEVAADQYATRFGGTAVSSVDVVDIDPSNTRATVISDLRCAANLSSAAYDCIILTQTLHIINDMDAVIRECVRLLRSGGVLLTTLPCASRICNDYGPGGDFWRSTPAGARKLLSNHFPQDSIEVVAYGNLRTTAAFLYGLAAHEIPAVSFDEDDPNYPLLVGVKAVRPRISSSASVTPLGGASVGAVLMYHRVTTTPSDIHGLAVGFADFQAQIAHLADHYVPLPLADFIDAARQDILPARAIAITFDDGYVDNYTHASHVLATHGVPATFFVAGDDFEQDREFWWDTLERIVLSPGSVVPHPIAIGLSDGAYVIPVTTVQQRLEAYWAIYHRIVDAPGDERDHVLHRLKHACDNSLDQRVRRMRGAEITALSKQPGVSIGAHSLDHLKLTKQSEARVQSEVHGSFEVLERLLERPASSFSYPFGAFNDVVLSIVGSRAAIAVTSDEDLVSATTHPLRIPRFKVDAVRGRHFGSWLASLFEPQGKYSLNAL
jgi:peptidoglycan/xylan/chitin deacetylase (PgdA/CDA1 family)/glycosyltransferase involved in cell wall biosynthesis